MLANKLLEERPASLRRTMEGGYHSRIASRLLILVALVSALFGIVGVETCLAHPPWEKHLWFPTMLIVLATGIIFSTLFHAIAFRLFGK